ncbi:MAG TPA: Rieske 2Fe-2S domain-containing protein [Xanthobacteraceae bacterium]
MSKHVVAPARELPPGSRKLVNVDGRAIVIFNIGGEFFALLNRCPHQGGNLCEGRLIGLVESSEPGHYRYSREGEILRCPWHGWEFDVRTGKSWCDPARIRTKTYDVGIEPGRSLVEGPYRAETFAVTVEQEYVVVEA